MISIQSIYVIGKGFVDPLDLSIGDMVYTLDDQMRVVVEPVQSIQVDYINEKVNRIYSGSQNSIGLEDTRYMYYSPRYGVKYLRWDEIPANTPNKEASETKYLPVLSSLETGEMTLTSNELDGLSRRFAIDATSREDVECLKVMSGMDAFAFIDLLDVWIGTDPGRGGLRGNQVKARKFTLKQPMHVMQEISKVAILAGYTSQIVTYLSDANILLVNHESIPTAGSIPKTQKYYKEYYTGYVFNIDAKNRPILGLGPADKRCYLPTSSSLQGET